MKKYFIICCVSTILMCSCNNTKINNNDLISENESLSKQVESMSIENESMNIELENCYKKIESIENQIESESSTQNETTEIRHGSKDDPIKLGESYTYKFIIPNYSSSMDNLTYGQATLTVLNVNDNIEVDVKFDSCNKDVSIQLGREIFDGSYFTTVSENLQENILIDNDVYTESGDFFNSYEALYPGGESIVNVNKDNAKYLVVHHNVYKDDDDINLPDSVEIEIDNGTKYELRYYTTWFLLE